MVIFKIASKRFTILIFLPSLGKITEVTTRHILVPCNHYPAITRVPRNLGLFVICLAYISLFVPVLSDQMFGISVTGSALRYDMNIMFGLISLKPEYEIAYETCKTVRRL